MTFSFTWQYLDHCAFSLCFSLRKPKSFLHNYRLGVTLNIRFVTFLLCCETLHLRLLLTYFTISQLITYFQMRLSTSSIKCEILGFDMLVHHILQELNWQSHICEISRWEKVEMVSVYTNCLHIDIAVQFTINSISNSRELITFFHSYMWQVHNTEMLGKKHQYNYSKVNIFNWVSVWYWLCFHTPRSSPNLQQVYIWTFFSIWVTYNHFYRQVC